MRSLPLILAGILFFSGIRLSAQIQVDQLEILSRKDWNAEPPKDGLVRHMPRYITIHHTGTRQQPQRSIQEKLQALQQFSFSSGALGDGTPKHPWPDVPYHFYIAVDGSVAVGRELQYQGDSNTDYDLSGHALIVVEGRFDSDELGPKQQEPLEKLVLALAKQYKIAPENISGHKDQAQTTCPGSNIYQFLPQLRKEVEAINPVRVKIGAEQLFSAGYYHLVKGKRVGLVTNHTGILPDGTHLIDLFHDNPEVELSLLFGPEHGLRGEEDTHVADGTDQKTGVPIISLYGEMRKPTPELLEQVDVLIFDIQDIGARFYTYIKTMLRVQEAAAEEGIPFIVLDRPNAISATYVDGPVGRPIEPNTGVGVIPVTHGMTVGELALMYNGEREANGLQKAALTVIPLQHYNRNQWYDETGLPWIKPSPNMLSIQTAEAYPATCLLEGTNFSEGRGTEFPFERIGATWVDAEELANQLNQYQLKGVEFHPTTYTPGRIVDGIEIWPPKFVDENVQAVEMRITNRDLFESAKAGVYILHAIKTLYPKEFEWRQGRIDGLLGTSSVREALDEEMSPDEIVKSWEEDLETFKKKRANYLLY